MKEEHNKLLVLSPQNVELEFNLANLGERAGAYMIDSSILIAYIIIFNLFLGPQVLDFSRLLPEWFFYVFLYIPVIFYRLFLEIFWRGKTVGKKQMKLSVIRLDGKPASPVDYFLRWVMEPIDFMTGGGLGLLAFFSGKYHQRLGDMAAGTTVVKDHDALSLFRMKDVKEEEKDIFTSLDLTDEEAALIEEVILRNKRKRDTDLVRFTADRFKKIVGKENQDLPDLKYLYELLRSHKLRSLEKIQKTQQEWEKNKEKLRMKKTIYSMDEAE